MLPVLHCAAAAALPAVCTWPASRARSSELLPAPTTPDWRQYLSGLEKFRAGCLTAINYTGEVYRVDALAWTRTTFIQPQMHPFDRYFYDPAAGYTVERWLDDLEERYGGVDSMLMWPTYPNLGIDDRDQFDLVRNLPGGPDALREVNRRLKARGVRMLLPYNPWDVHTAPANASDAVSLATLAKLLDADGFNGDIMSFVPRAFYDAGTRISHPIAIEPEKGGAPDSLDWDPLGWGYFFNDSWQYPSAPGVDMLKWLEPRRMTNVCDRWSTDRRLPLQQAWFNGVGYETWENVWGIWNGVTSRDGAAVRRVAAMLRYFGAAGHLRAADWQPHYPTGHPSVYASRFPQAGSTLWTVVNWDAGAAGHVEIEAGAGGWYDCYAGVALEVVNGSVRADVEAGGYGCVLQVTAQQPAGLVEFLSRMRNLTRRPLSDYDATWRPLQQERMPVPPPKQPGAAGGPPTVDIPAGDFRFRVHGTEMEPITPFGPEMYSAVGVQYPWEPHPVLVADRTLTMPAFRIEKHPVTRAAFAAYLSSSGYAPSDAHNYLKDWDWGSGKPVPPQGGGDCPVTWVSYAEAAGFCAHYGRRLPREWEWQYAAQGTDARAYPWGSEHDPSRYPAKHTGRTIPGAVPVGQFPGGDSPFGVSDLVGSVWQYTDAWQDEHTRFAILRGGSNYYPASSRNWTGMWYFPHQIELTRHGKYFLMDAAYERAGTLGFRCVEDVGAAGGAGLTADRFSTAGAADWVTWRGGEAVRRGGRTLVSVAGGAAAGPDVSIHVNGTACGLESATGFTVTVPSANVTAVTLHVAGRRCAGRITATQAGRVWASTLGPQPAAFTVPLVAGGGDAAVRWEAAGVLSPFLAGRYGDPRQVNQDLGSAAGWAHWGPVPGCSAGLCERKGGPKAAAVGAVEVVGGGSPSLVAQSRYSFSWPGQDRRQGGVAASGIGRGFRVSFNLTEPATVSLFLCVYAARGVLNVTSGAARYTDANVVAYWERCQRYDVDAAAGALTAEWTVGEYCYNEGTEGPQPEGDVRLLAVEVSSALPPPAVALGGVVLR